MCPDREDLLMYSGQEAPGARPSGGRGLSCTLQASTNGAKQRKMPRTAGERRVRWESGGGGASSDGFCSSMKQESRSFIS